jgi:predicted GIY-YIG superfamily endonuclease
MLYFIYALVDPRTDAVAYVGLTNNPNARLQDHLNNFVTNRKKGNWVRQLRDEHLEPQMKILEVVDTREAAIEREKHWINHYISMGASLANIEHTLQRRNSPEPKAAQGAVQKSLPGPNVIQEAIQKNLGNPWVPMRQAAKLLGTSTNKIARLAERQRIKFRNHPFDERARLVDLNELQALFASAPVLVRSEEDEDFSWYEFTLPTE